MKWFCVLENDRYILYKVPSRQMEAFKKEYENPIAKGDNLQDIIKDLQVALEEKKDLSVELYEEKKLAERVQVEKREGLRHKM